MSTPGIIREIKDGKIHIQVQLDQSGCEACAVRAFCRKKGCEENLMILNERPGFKSGDRVDIEESGNILLKTSLIAYGIPLIFFIGGIFLGGFIPSGIIPPELIRFLCGCTALAVGAFFGQRLAKSLSQKLDSYITLK